MCFDTLSLKSTVHQGYKFYLLNSVLDVATSGHLDYAGQAVSSHFITFFILQILYVLKQVPSYFICLGESCFAVTLQKMFCGLRNFTGLPMDTSLGEPFHPPL